MKKIDFQKELNDEQYKVVTASQGPHLILAGAGSGKTRTLVYRVAWLIAQGVKPDKILLLTFTNKAANEMKERVRSLLDVKINDKLPVWGGTFHSISNRLLRIYGHHVGVERNFTILDTEDSKSLLKDISKSFLSVLPQGRRPSVNILKETISFSINSNIKLAESLERKFSEWLPLVEIFEKIATEYKKRKRASNSLDFDDLLLYGKMLSEHPDAGKMLAKKWEYVLVDEYQDTNTLQAQFVYNLAKEHQNILVVGDDAQSIYSFRAADIQNILAFPKVFEKTKTYKLETNYRSTPEIIALANLVIAENVNQFEKNLQSINPQFIKPELIAHHSGIEEAHWIANRIEGMLAEGIEAEELVVLFRAAHHSQNLEMELNKRGIAYQMRGGLKFFERAHIKDIIAWLRILANHKDEVSWGRILKLYPGIGPATVQKIFKEIASLDDLKDFDKLELRISSAAAEGWQQVAKILVNIVNQTKSNPAELIRLLLEDYKDYLTQQYADYRQRQDDLEQFAIFATRYQDLGEFLNEVSLQENFQVDDQAQSGIILSTIHQSKGLEWTGVFVMNVTNKSFPHPLAVSEAEQEEERRLFYVAITRAKRHLYLSYPLSEFKYSGYQALKPSSFLSSLDSKFLNFNDLARSATYQDDDIGYSMDDSAGEFWDGDQTKKRGIINPGEFLPDIDEW
ncbi:ATP-dependent helicase [bacterium]|nr:ATP-dependent helicase [bacterium]